MIVRVCRVAAGVAVALATWAGPAYAQGAGVSPALQGTVVTAEGTVVAGAEVTATHAGTGVERSAITNSRGAFSVTGLAAGTYTVTVRAAGFTNAVQGNIELGAAAPAALRLILARAPMQSAAIETTADAAWIARLPLPTRNALDFVTFLPGVDTPGLNRESTVNGMPQSTIAITFDGVNVQDSFLKTRDGFFALVTPRQDALASVTLLAATPGAEASGDGAVRISFVTRAGTSEHHGTAYWATRPPGLAGTAAIHDRRGTAQPTIRLNQYGASQGGPIGPSGAAARAFFFVNYEELRQETRLPRGRTMLTPEAQAGLFRYDGGAVNLLQLAAAGGQLASVDPTVAGLLAAIRTAAAGSLILDSGDPNVQSATIENIANRLDRQPAIRVDYIASARQRLNGSFTRASVESDPDLLNQGDPAFPSLPNRRAQQSARYQAQATWRALLRASWINELRIGGAWGPIDFAPDLTAAQFQNQGGFNLQLPLVTPATVANTATRRDVSNWSLDETLTMPLGRHQLSVGGVFTRVTASVTSQTIASTLRFGLDPGDPAAGLFTTANFPGASSATLDEARALYALLTGRVTAIDADIRLDPGTNRFGFLGPTTERGRLNQISLFASDVWRPSAFVSITAGVRWEVQRPFTPLNDVWAAPTLLDACGISGVGNGPFGRGCLLFQPGLERGVHPTFVAFPRGSEAYRTELGNLAPSAGIAVRPKIDTGILRRILGDPEQATFHAGYSLAFERRGLADFFDILGANPGARVALTRNASNGNLIVDGGGLPLLLRDGARLAPLPMCPEGTISVTCQQLAPVFPRPAVAGDSVNIFDPRIKRPFAVSYSGGLSRSLGRDATVDIRYVGTRYHDGWVTENFNEPALFESGFLDEFRMAQANLLANLAAGRGATFAFFGPGSGTAPLPLYLALFSGVAQGQAIDPALYAPAVFTNPALLAPLSTVAPDPIGALNALLSSAERRANALAAGLSSNHFLLNPDIGTGAATVTRNAAEAHTDALQVELSRRLSRGLALTASYAYTRAWRTTIDSVRFDRYFIRSIASVPHAVKAAWTYDVPLGRGRAAGTAMPAWADAVIGGWQVTGTTRVQSGRAVEQSRIRLVGMSVDDLQAEFRPRVDEATGTITMLPADIILNTRRAFSVDPTSATGFSALGVPEGRFIAPSSGPTCTGIFPGDCGEPRQILLRGPIVARLDLGFRKAFAIGGSRSLELHFDLLNALGADNFIPVFNPGSAATIFQVTRAIEDIHNTFDPGGRLGQFGVRIRW
jgi:hypothetical protein